MSLAPQWKSCVLGAASLCCAVLPAQAAIDASAMPASTPAPISAPERSAALQLTRLHDVGSLSQRNLDDAREATISLLVRQNLKNLDPDSRLNATAQRKLARQLARDIRPVVSRALAQVDRQAMATALVDLYARRLTQAQTGALLHYYRSADGKSYLLFTRELDATLGAGLAALGAQPFSFSRSTDDAATLARRRALIDMSLAARQIRAARSGGAHPSALAVGLASDLLVSQCGKPLDALALRNAGRLKGFAAFQQTPAARAEDRVLWLWSSDIAARLQPVLKQAAEALADKQPAWRELMRTLATTPATE